MPEECDFLVTVAGLSALEQPWERASRRVGFFHVFWKNSDGRGYFPHFAGRLWYPFGVGSRDVFFLNQADVVGWDRAELLRISLCPAFGEAYRQNNTWRRRMSMEGV